MAAWKGSRKLADPHPPTPPDTPPPDGGRWRGAVTQWGRWQVSRQEVPEDYESLCNVCQIPGCVLLREQNMPTRSHSCAVMKVCHNVRWWKEWCAKEKSFPTWISFWRETENKHPCDMEEAHCNTKMRHTLWSVAHKICPDLMTLTVMEALLPLYTHFNNYNNNYKDIPFWFSACA